MSYNTWTFDDGRKIDLVTPDQFAVLRDGTALVSIDGQTVVKGGVDPLTNAPYYIDLDTRGGFIAFGLPHSESAAAAPSHGREETT